jgi:hypothetical protein
MRHIAGTILALVAVFFCGLATPRAEELRIGHLETNDDTGINWLYFVCNKSNATQMTCDIFQTLVMKKKTQNEIDSQLKQVAADPLAAFNNTFAAGCKPLVENEAKFQQAMQSGIGIDGNPINKRVVLSGWPMMQAIIEVCKHPTGDSAAKFFRLLTETDQHSCKVHNFHSQSTFVWNQQTASWVTQEGPTGPCGAIVIGTLTQDPRNHFWHYVEKHIRTNPKGVILNGQSCEKLPELTLNYSWQTTETREGCDFIESFPD